MGDAFGIAHARFALVMLELERGNNERAAALSDESIPVFTDCREWIDAAWQCVLSATAYGRTGEITIARDRLLTAFQYAIDLHDAAVTVAALEQAATLAALVGEDDTALRLVGASRAARQSTGHLLRTDETALRISGARVDGPQREALLDQGTSWTLEEATQHALQFLTGPAARSPRPDSKRATM